MSELIDFSKYRALREEQQRLVKANQAIVLVGIGASGERALHYIQSSSDDGSGSAFYDPVPPGSVQPVAAARYLADRRVAIILGDFGTPFDLEQARVAVTYCRANGMLTVAVVTTPFLPASPSAHEDRQKLLASVDMCVVVPWVNLADTTPAATPRNQLLLNTIELLTNPALRNGPGRFTLEELQETIGGSGLAAVQMAYGGNVLEAIKNATKALTREADIDAAAGAIIEIVTQESVSTSMQAVIGRFIENTALHQLSPWACFTIDPELRGGHSRATLLVTGLTA